MAAESAVGLLESLHYIYPALVFTYFMVSTVVAVCTLETLKAAANPKDKKIPQTAIVKVMLFIVLTYFSQLTAVVVRSVLERTWLGRDDVVVGWLSCFMVFGIQTASLAKTEHPVWYPLYGSWLLSVVFEFVLAVEYFIYPQKELSGFPKFVYGGFSSCRAVLLVILALTYYIRRDGFQSHPDTSDEECQALLGEDAQEREREASSNGHAPNGHAPNGRTPNGRTPNGHTRTQGYGSTEANGSATKKRPVELPFERRMREGREKLEKRLQEEGNWFTYIKKFAILWPYIWPVGNRGLQFRAVLVGITLLTKNALNLLIPRQMGIIMDILGGTRQGNPWIQVILFAALKFLASDSGIDYVRQRIYFPLEYFSRDALITAAYRHILNLSADFHDSQSTSDTILAIRGGETISSMVDKLAFSAFPRIVDLVIAIIYLSLKFGPYEGFITISTAICYLHVASILVDGMKEARRDQVASYYDKNNLLQTGVEGWHTVTAFNQTGYEDNRHTNAVRIYTEKTKVLYFKWFSIHALQSLVLLAGLLSGAFLAVARIQSGQATPGDFTMLLMYWGQLTGPLMFFSSLGKQVSNDLIHAERLLDMMYRKPTVTNKKGARPLEYREGKVEFDSVCFTYDDRKNIIKDLTFTVTGGQCVAFVGATGAGKSTILKLLSRLYDVSSGSIKVDGQDIRDIDLASLRGRIGSVPQSPVLFNDTILNNIRYARITASDEDVHEACKAAWIHDKIESFSDGYDTRVGERGIKLSGGELQRVAIARAMLKDPDLVVLDEATSAVDTDTEHKIQQSLARLCDGRTTFVVAHRLSTIMNADRIIVIGDGTILESGDHETLIRAGGKYADLWSKQVFLKPKKNDKGASESSTPSTLINDLEPETAEAELSKIREAVERAAKRQASVSDSSQKDEGTETSGETKCERLNPVAPEFTPRSLMTSLALPHTPSTIVFPSHLSMSVNFGVGSHMRQDGAFHTVESLNGEKDGHKLPQSAPTRAFGVAQPGCSPTTQQQHLPKQSSRQFETPGLITSSQPTTTASSLADRVRSKGSSSRLRRTRGESTPTSNQKKEVKFDDDDGRQNNPASLDIAVFHRPEYSRRGQSRSEPGLNTADSDEDLDGLPACGIRGYRKASGPVTMAPSGDNTPHGPEMSSSISPMAVAGKHPGVANRGQYYTPLLTPTPGGDNRIVQGPLHVLKDSSIPKVATLADQADNMQPRRDKRGHHWRKRTHKGKPSSTKEAR